MFFCIRKSSARPVKAPASTCTSIIVPAGTGEGPVAVMATATGFHRW